MNRGTWCPAYAAIISPNFGGRLRNFKLFDAGVNSKHQLLEAQTFCGCDSGAVPIVNALDRSLCAVNYCEATMIADWEDDGRPLLNVEGELRVDVVLVNEALLNLERDCSAG